LELGRDGSIVFQVTNNALGLVFISPLSEHSRVDSTHYSSSGFSNGGAIGSLFSKWASRTSIQYRTWELVQISLLFEEEGVEVDIPYGKEVVKE
jgi:hypothetical protein